MRIAVAIALLTTCHLGFAAAGEGLTGAWKTHPAPKDEQFIAEFFDDGTVAIIDCFGVHTLKYRKSKNPKLFEVHIDATEDEPGRHYANFEPKSDKVAFFTILGAEPTVFRMIPGGIDD
jgi:hypothetical protein